MSKKVYLGAIINLLVFGLSLFLGANSILAFIILIYITPALINTVLISKENTLSKTIMPTITTIIYCVFSYIFMNQGTFSSFVSANSKDIGELSIQINNNLLGIGQIIFVFLINFGAIYITNKLVRGESYATSK